MQRDFDIPDTGRRGPRNANQAALLERLTPPSAGGIAPSTGTVYNPDPVDQPQQYTGWGQYMPQGVEQRNIDAGVTDPKYQIARIQSHFDPTKGITPEMVTALNGLGIGSFTSDARDKLYVDGQMDPRFKDVVSSDIINNFGGSNVSWNGWGGTSVGPSDPRVKGPAVMPSMDPSAWMQAVTNRPQDEMSAMQGISEYTQPSRHLQALLAQLRGEQ